MKHAKEESYHYFNRRVGWLRLQATEKGVREVTFALEPRTLTKRQLSPLWQGLVSELDMYFSGRPIRFFTPLDISCASPFFHLVWQALQDIPYGQTISYGGVASAIGRPRAAQAVGLAIGRNPLPIIIPCHRVVRSDGSLGGYGPGIELKRSLLALENALPRNAVNSQLK